MFFTTRSAERPYHLGSFPMESLPRDDAVFAEEAARPPACAPKYNNPPKGPLAKSLRTYLDIGADPDSYDCSCLTHCFISRN